jgi:hypothetical protein
MKKGEKLAGLAKEVNGKPEKKQANNGAAFLAAPKAKKTITLDDLSPEVIETLAQKLQSKMVVAPAGAPSNDKSLVMMEVSDTDINDVLKEPAIFFTYSMGKTIFDDKRNGRIVVPPFSYKNEEGKVVSMPYHFKKQYATEKQGNARDARKMWISVCVESSKKRAEWLRGHSMFNSMFFEDIRKVSSVDVNLQEKLVEAAMQVRRLNDNEVILRCQNEHLPMHKNIENMRSELSRHIAFKELERGGKSSQAAALKSLLTIDEIGKAEAKNIRQAS